jgi:hypothetical protein
MFDPPIDKKRDLLYSVIQSRTNYRSIYTILLGVRTTIYNTRCYVSTLYAYCWFLDIWICKTKIFGKTYAHTKSGIDLFFKAASPYRCTVSFLMSDWCLDYICHTYCKKATDIRKKGSGKDTSCSYHMVEYFMWWDQESLIAVLIFANIFAWLFFSFAYFAHSISS